MQLSNLTSHFGPISGAAWLVLFVLSSTGCQALDAFGPALPPITYLGWDESELNQLYSVVPGESPRQITAEASGVYGFTPSPAGKSIVYSTVAADGRSTVKLVAVDGTAERALIHCQKAQCTPQTWSSDGARVIYERRPLRENDVSASPELWWLDVEGGATQPLLEDEQAKATNARFSPDGDWLSYVATAEEAVVLYNVSDGRTQTIPSEIGVPPAWSPSGEKVVVPLLDLVIIHGEEGDDHLEHTHDYVAATHLFTVDVESGTRTDITGDLGVEDSVPTYSPDGQWVAFGRRSSGTPSNRQLWLMKADGTDQKPLLDDPAHTHGPPSWSPDGRYLLFQRFATDEGSDKPGVWYLDLESGERHEVVREGMQPVWLAP